MSPRVYLRRLSFRFLVLSFGLVPAISAPGAQTADTLASPGVRLPQASFPGLTLRLPLAQRPLGRESLRLATTSWIAEREARLVMLRLAERGAAQRVATLSRPRDTATDPLAGLQAMFDTLPRAAAPDTALAALVDDLLGDRIGLVLNASFDAKVDRSRNETCTTSQAYSYSQQCAAGFQPSFDFKFDMQAGGDIAQRLFVNVDFDSRREFDASNNISVFYRGKSDEMVERLEVGNVSLQLPPSQFITSGIPQGHYGIQAIGQLGPARFRAIAAQQKGNVSGGNVYTVGERTLRTEDRVIEDYQVEVRRFFFTIDPLLFGAAYPNIDILDGPQLRALAEALPDTVRPRRVSVYRLRIGSQPVNPNGPRFAIIGDPASRAGQVYELLRENEHYYVDPSQLWIALAQPLNLQTERLVVAYTLRINGRDTVVARLGGTPDVAHTPEREQLAHLVWDPQLRPSDPAFRRAIRSVYTVAGEEMRRHTVAVRIVAGSGAGQEKPLAGTAETYLQMFGLAQLGNPALFDVDNRLWPRPGDPNVVQGSISNQKLIRDYYLVLPSLRPFARDGLVAPGNPTSDTLYTTPVEDLYSSLHPQAQYRIRLQYEVEGAGDVSTLMLGAVQLRPNSEQVVVDNIPLVRDQDYTIDYEIGMLTFARPDTLFPGGQARRVAVRFEENPLFVAAPTRILGLASQIPLERGELSFVAISQSQSTGFTRPPLGYEPQSALIAGVNGNFSWDAPAVSRLLERIPTVRSTSLSRFDLQGEFATSRPQPNTAGQAYIESFENEGGVSVPTAEAAWHYSSQPAMGVVLPQRLGFETFSLGRASTLAWQNAGLNLAGFPVTYTFSQIDPQIALTGSAFSAPEPLLWLTLYPLSIGGLMSDRTKQFQWKHANPQSGLHWRSIRTGFGASGADLSRVEYIEFWTYADTSTARLATNPRLIIDLGDVSENSVALGPTDLTITPLPGGAVDSVFTGKGLMGYNTMNSERDTLTRSFNQAKDDRGLPGDVAPLLSVFGPNGFSLEENVPLCARGVFRLLLLGDSRTNCTVQNGRLDEEDVDQDYVLNFTEAQADQERVRRYIVDLSNRATFNRIGRCNLAAFDTTGGGLVTATDVCWVQVRVPFRVPDDSLNGGPNIRRVKMLRLTMVSGDGLPDTAFSQIPIARMRFVGSPWVKRANASVRGIAGDEPGTGFVIASVIGTQDRDTVRGIDYESPPGVTDEAERQQTGLEGFQTQINERSLRLLAGGLEPFDRAEAYLRFPEGAKNFMNYRELRVWARGRGNGWGQDGELQFYIKLGRDQNNFYMYRTPVNGGAGRTAWLPEVAVDFDRLFTMRTQLQNMVNGVVPDSIACTGVDSVLIARSGVPAGSATSRHAVCADGYIVYSAEPAVNPPNLAQVQELSVGMVRVPPVFGGSPVFLGDTLELWIDDIRLTDVERTPGYAGQLGASLALGDVANVRVNLSRVDGNFRQLAEQPSFVGSSGLNVGTNIRLERLLPGATSLALPLTVNYLKDGSEPLFISQTDLPGGGVEGLRTPSRSVTSYSLSVRRSRPLTGSLFSPIVNNLQLNTSVARSNSRSEFSEGRNATWNAGVNYSVLANPRFLQMPSWLTSVWPFSGLPGGRVRWNPVQVSLSSQMGRTDDRRTSFSRAVRVDSDTGRRVTGQTHVWRNIAGLDLRPVPSLSASLRFTSVRDLRDYGDTSAVAIVAGSERERVMGLDVGLERERQVTASTSLSPVVASWLQPTISFSSNYTLQRDPQSRVLVRTGDTSGAFRLPRRLFNSQSIGANLRMDPARALTVWLGDSGWVARSGRTIEQLDFQYSRSLNSAYDGAPFTPGPGYQFGLGDLSDFRQTRGLAATVAGVVNTYSVATGLQLPVGLQVRASGSGSSTENYTRRLDNTQALVEGTQRTWPDLRFAWNYRPRVTRLVSNVTASVSYRSSEQTTLAISTTPDAPDDHRVVTSSGYLPSLQLDWGPTGRLRTNIGGELRVSTDNVPGSSSETRVQRFIIDVSRPFILPQRIGARQPVQTQVSWEREFNSTYVLVASAAQRSRLADAGRSALNVNVRTEVAQDFGFRLQAARVISYDNNYNIRFSTFVVTATFSLTYSAGQFQ